MSIQHTAGQELNELSSFDFKLTPELEAGEPPEARGLSRDEVRTILEDLAQREEGRLGPQP